ncbi:MAG: mechanosensitive ion channel family protein, partial [Leptolyngbya sp. SIO1D8]|nr:mechanosensitive ion channel family protein [Leptolyngbya sp. SIO1D8]
MPTDFLKQIVLGNTIADYLLAIAFLLAGILVTHLIRIIIIGRLKHWAQRSATDLDDRLLRLIEKPSARLLYLGSFYLSLSELNLHDGFRESLTFICIILATLLVVQLTGSLVEYGVRVYCVTRRSDVTLETSLNALIPAIKIIVWVIG